MSDSHSSHGDPKGRTEPGFQRHVFTCVNERAPGNPRGSCHDKGGGAVAAAFKAAVASAGLQTTVRANKSLCLDFCEHGPCVVVYPDGVWYTIGDVDRDVNEIVASHLVGGVPVQRCLMKIKPS